MTKLILAACLALWLQPALGGPPLICQSFETGGAKSLPWKHTGGWLGADPQYDVSRLTEDTLAILTPEASLPLRMETMRRASIYAARTEGMAAAIAARLHSRALNSEAAGKPDPLAWFDAGYWVESVRQAAFIYRYDMLSSDEKAAWRIRSGLDGMDGYRWVQKAVDLGGRGMERALSLMEGYRKADLAASGR